MILGFALIIFGLMLLIVGIFYLGYCIGQDLAHRELLQDWLFDYIDQEITCGSPENLTCEDCGKLTCKNLTCGKILTCEYQEITCEEEGDGDC